MIWWILGAYVAIGIILFIITAESVKKAHEIAVSLYPDGQNIFPIIRVAIFIIWPLLVVLYIKVRIKLKEGEINET